VRVLRLFAKQALHQQLIALVQLLDITVLGRAGTERRLASELVLAAHCIRFVPARLRAFCAPYANILQLLIGFESIRIAEFANFCRANVIRLHGYGGRTQTMPGC
jgi:hypothetical protein